MNVPNNSRSSNLSELSNNSSELPSNSLELPINSLELPSYPSEFENDVQISCYEENVITETDDTIVNDEGESDGEGESYDEGESDVDDEYLAIAYQALKESLGEPQLTDDEAVERAISEITNLRKKEAELIEKLAKLKANRKQNCSERPKGKTRDATKRMKESTDLIENNENLTENFHKLNINKVELKEQTNTSFNYQTCGSRSVQ